MDRCKLEDKRRERGPRNEEFFLFKSHFLWLVALIPRSFPELFYSWSESQLFISLRLYWKDDGLLDQSALLNRTALNPIVNNSYEAG